MRFYVRPRAWLPPRRFARKRIDGRTRGGRSVDRTNGHGADRRTSLYVPRTVVGEIRSGSCARGRSGNVLDARGCWNCLRYDRQTNRHGQTKCTQTHWERHLAERRYWSLVIQQNEMVLAGEWGGATYSNLLSKLRNDRKHAFHRSNATLPNICVYINFFRTGVRRKSFCISKD